MALRRSQRSRKPTEVTNHKPTSKAKTKRAKSTTLLGLQRYQEESTTGPVISLGVGDILGRNPKKPIPHHVNLGIDRVKGGMNVSRKVAVVASVTRTQIVLELMADSRNTTRLVQYKLASQDWQVLSPETTKLTLPHRAILQMAPEYQFQVVSTPPVESPPKKAKLSAKSQPKASSDYQPITVLPPTVTPFRPSWNFGVVSKTCHRPTKEELQEQLEMEAEARLSRTPQRNNDDSDDEDDTLCDMHSTFVNTYWKALNSKIPQLGAELFQMVLRDGQLPPQSLCTDLVRLITFGPHTGKITMSDTIQPPPNAIPFFDAPRLQQAMTYVRTVVHKHPSIMYERLALAAGTDYWKTVLDQLHTLIYVDPENDDPEHIPQATMQSLQLQANSLDFLDILLTALLPRKNPRLPLVRDLHQYGGKNVCQVAAQAMAHVWAQHGHHLSQASHMTGSVLQLTSLLSRVFGCLVDHFGLGLGPTTTLLWNAMDKLPQPVLLLWICSLDRPDLERTVAKRAKVLADYQRMEGL